MAGKTQRTADSVSADDARNDGRSVVLWTRRPVCGPRTTIIDRLSSLRTNGTLDDITVKTWPDQIVISERTEHDTILETIDRYEQWATDHGLSLRPPFETRTAGLLVGGSREVLTTPMMTAAVYDDDIVGVYPCSDGEHTWTITDYLDRCEIDAELPHKHGDSPVPDGRS